MIENQLATITYSIIQTKFNNTEYFYSQFKTNINRKLKSLSREYLTEKELSQKGINIANNMISYFSYITKQKIELKISKEIVKELLNTRYKMMRSEINKKR